MDQHRFKVPFVLVGRDRTADLVLDDPQVSRRHAFLQCVAGRIIVVDLDSRTKVCWEGEDAPRSRGWLDPDQHIQIGLYRIRWARHDSSDQEESDLSRSGEPGERQPLDSGSMPKASLELPIQPHDCPSLWPVTGEFALVGRYQDCQLVLNDDSISRFHAALVPTPSGLWVVDLLAREGVYVNGQRIRWAWLAHGDTLRIGRFTFILRYETPPEHITRSDVPLASGASLAERPATELALRKAPPDSDRRAVAVRPRVLPPAPVQARTPALAAEPDLLVPAGAELLEPMPLAANSMAMFQQQMRMMESFHNDMMLMVQMFVAMHKEQSASIRHELEMVQRLTRELSALEARRAQTADQGDQAAAAGAGRTATQPASSQMADRIARSSDRIPNGVNPGDSREIAAPEPTGRSWEVPRKTGPTQAAGIPVSNGSSPEGSEQMHAQLTERIAQLQRERQGYWQRILRTISP